MIGEAVEMFSKINSLDNLQEIVCERSLTLHEHGQQNGLKYFLKKIFSFFLIAFSEDILMKRDGPKAEEMSH